MGIVVALMLALLASASSAGEEQAEVPMHERPGSEEWPAWTGDRGERPVTRPLDESDAEMKALVEEFFAMVPCGTETSGICDAAVEHLMSGGDRAASYLIRQYEEGIAEGYPNRVTYLRPIGLTRSDVAYRYLSALVAERAAAYENGSLEDRSRLLWALEALGNTANPAVADEAVAIFARFGDVDVRRRAVRAIDFVQRQHSLSPAVVDQLEAGRQAMSELQLQEDPVRASAERGLRGHLDRVLLRAASE